MRSHDVIRQAVEEPGVKAVAAGLKVSQALVYKWCEGSGEGDSAMAAGARNPLDRVRDLFILTRDVRLIRWLCNEAGGFFVTNPEPDMEKSADQTVYDQTRSMMREFSELLSSITASLENDPYVDKGESDEIRQKWEALKSAGERFVISCERGLYHVRKSQGR